jgi:hypothetical protein
LAPSHAKIAVRFFEQHLDAADINSHAVAG